MRSRLSRTGGEAAPRGGLPGLQRTHAQSLGKVRLLFKRTHRDAKRQFHGPRMLRLKAVPREAVTDPAAKTELTLIRLLKQHAAAFGAGEAGGMTGTLRVMKGRRIIFW
jgi:hypothetical protein